MRSVVSIVTVCYNASDLIEETIKSVASQTYPYIEYIIIDGGSSDGTLDIIRKYEDVISNWTSEKDSGIYDAMNKGIRKASGRWINFMNAGDAFCSETVVEEFVSKIEDDTIIAYGDTLLVYDIGERLMTPDKLEGIRKRMVFGHQSTFIDSKYHKNHLYDVSFRSSGDYDFFYKSYCDGVKFQYIPMKVARYKAQDGVSSSYWKIVAKEDAKIHGVEKTFKWQLTFVLMRVNVCVREWLKKSLPNCIVALFKQYHLNNIGTSIDNE